MELKIVLPAIQMRGRTRKITNNLANEAHYHTKHKWKQLIYQQIFWATKQQFVKPFSKNDYPLIASYDFYFQKRLPDWVNVSQLVKYLEDGLMNAKILENDNNNFVVGGSIMIYKTQEPEDYCVIKYKSKHS